MASPNATICLGCQRKFICLWKDAPPLLYQMHCLGCCWELSLRTLRLRSRCAVLHPSICALSNDLLAQAKSPEEDCGSSCD